MPLPVDYEMFGRSFDGIDYRFISPIKERFPDDYARILEWFPMAGWVMRNGFSFNGSGFGQGGGFSMRKGR